MSNNKKENFTVFTVCNLAYLPKALVLAESVLKYNNLKLKIFLIEKKIPIDLSSFPADFIWAEEMNIPNFHQLAFKYDIIEFSTCLKPYITMRLLESFENVIFLDPDTCVFNSLQPILDDLALHSIVLTPHYTTPQTDDPSESDIGMMRFGSFNLGFFAIRHSQQGIAFLKWWSARCIEYCYMESQFGLSTDQKWVAIAPCFFEDLYVSFNLGYNAAPWNSFERKISKIGDGSYLVNNKYPLIFFHFSNFDRNDLEYLNKRSLYEKNVRRLDLQELGQGYLKAIEANTTPLSSTNYGFDYMSGGEYISPTFRRAYACIQNELPKNHDPFDSDGVVGIFGKNNFLVVKGSTPYRTEGYAALKENQLQLKIINIFMRLVLRIVGPNRFQNFSRLLVYLSSYRQNRGLWKY